MLLYGGVFGSLYIALAIYKVTSLRPAEIYAVIYSGHGGVGSARARGHTAAGRNFDGYTRYALSTAAVARKLAKCAFA